MIWVNGTAVAWGADVMIARRVAMAREASGSADVINPVPTGDRCDEDGSCSMHKERIALYVSL